MSFVAGGQMEHSVVPVRAFIMAGMFRTPGEDGNANEPHDGVTGNELSI